MYMVRFQLCLASLVIARLAVTRPFCLRELSLRQRASVLSESTSRSSEKVSPKRECATTPLFPFSSPRLGERSSLERESLSPERGL
ncbi:hypothetical protein DEO72_LG6g2582 [Vigna unguiculata]|uniref:Secreted protein n=1 Tax=Vigna unguiculata TaxID=3917 RepID=A0A4D6M913_VIGUN|nr:hypothetical protein DEO72_LG6g2582 [Vigna unguiculata]